jgi:hypothetical protein
MNRKMPLFDLQTPGFWVLKNATKIARLSKKSKYCDFRKFRCCKINNLCVRKKLVLGFSTVSAAIETCRKELLARPFGHC